MSERWPLKMAVPQEDEEEGVDRLFANQMRRELVDLNDHDRCLLYYI